MHGALDARARLEEAAMAGKGRASVNDMKRVEVLVLMEIAQQSESGGTYGFSRKTLERGGWYLRGIRAGMLVQDMLGDELADR